MTQTNYQEKYEEFMNNYKNGVTSAEEVGQMIARFGQYIGEANARFGTSQKAFDRIMAITAQTDDSNGKPISMAKAEIIARATPEGAELIVAKMQRESVDRQIVTLQSLQKGVINEFNHTSNM